MSLKIGTNISSLQALRSLGNAQTSLDSSTRQLATGQRITRAGDDAAGLSISSHLKAGIRSTAAAQRNAHDGISLIEVAEGAFNELSNMLVRLRELAIQSSSDTIGHRERGMVQAEAEQILEEMDRITLGTEWNGVNILNGESLKLEIQIGTGSSESSRLELDTEDWATTTYALGAGGVRLAFKESSRRSLGMIDQAMTWLSGTRAEVASVQNRLQAISSILGESKISHSAANSRIADTDIAQATAEQARATIQTNAAISVTAQANASGALALKLLS